MAYIYKGTPQPQPRATKPINHSFNPEKCGKYAGYQQHRRDKTAVCEPCANARRTLDRECRERKRQACKRPAPQFNPGKCGTYAGYKQHCNYGIPSCAPCKAANLAHVNAWHEKRRAA